MGELVGWSRSRSHQPQVPKRDRQYVVAVGHGAGASQLRIEGAGLPHDGPCLPSGQAIASTVGNGSAQEEKPSAIAIRRSTECLHVQRLRCHALRPPKEPTSDKMTLQVLSPQTTSVPD